MIKKIALIFIFYFSLTSLSFSQKKYQPFVVDQVLSGKVNFAYDSSISLPKGEWIVKIVDNSSTFEEKGSNITTNIYNIGFFDIDKKNKILKRYIELNFSDSRTVESKGKGHWKMPINCTRENFYVYEKIYGGYTFNCWTINHYRFSLSHKLNTFEKNLKELIISENIKIPQIIIGSEHFYASPKNGNIRHRVRYFVNPESEGIDPPVYTNWDTSEYQKIKISQYPKKKAYMDNFVISSANFHIEFQEGLQMYKDEKIDLSKYLKK